MTLDLAVNYGYDMKGTGIKKIDKLEFMKTFKTFKRHSNTDTGGGGVCGEQRVFRAGNCSVTLSRLTCVTAHQSKSTECDTKSDPNVTCGLQLMTCPCGLPGNKCTTSGC